ncbi:hypothetical protein JW824_11850 [bacterium]|nr:hypothetical protein [bacterium]
MKLLKTIVDLTSAILVQGQISRKEALDLIQATRRKVLSIFPDKEETYDLIYQPRFERLLREHIWKEFLTISEN